MFILSCLHLIQSLQDGDSHFGLVSGFWKLVFSFLNFFHLCNIVLVLIDFGFVHCVGDELANVWEVGDNLAINADNMAILNVCLSI